MIVPHIRCVAMVWLLVGLATPGVAARDLWGYIDKSGRVVIQPQYGWGGSFSCSRAKVELKQADGSYSDAFIDQQGNKIAKSAAGSFWSAFSDGLEMFEVSAGKRSMFGYMDKNGKQVISPQFAGASDFSQGIAAIRTIDNRSELIDKTGKVVMTFPADVLIDTHYFSVTPERLVCAKFLQPGGATANAIEGYISLDGERRLVDDRFSFPSVPSEGMIKIATRNGANGKPCTAGFRDKYGFMDCTGKVAIEPRFDSAENFAEGLALVSEGNHLRFIDKAGKTAIKLPDNCIDAVSFSEGRAAVCLRADAASGDKVKDRWGFIDRSGRLVIPARYYANPLSPSTPAFKDGLAPLAVGDEVHPRYGFIDKQGRWVVEPKYKLALGFADGLAAVCTGKTGFEPDEWKANVQSRGDLFDLFVKQYRLIGMKRTAVIALLGKPESHYENSDRYPLSRGWCGNGNHDVEIHYDAWQRVDAYRKGRGSTLRTKPWIRGSAGDVLNSRAATR